MRVKRHRGARPAASRRWGRCTAPQQLLFAFPAKRSQKQRGMRQVQYSRNLAEFQKTWNYSPLEGCMLQTSSRLVKPRYREEPTHCHDEAPFYPITLRHRSPSPGTCSAFHCYAIAQPKTRVMAGHLVHHLRIYIGTRRVTSIPICHAPELELLAPNPRHLTIQLCHDVTYKFR